MKQEIEKIITLARSLLGRPYKYGATEADVPQFFDCSLFVKYLFKEIGIDLPRSTLYQAHNGVEVELKDIIPGDLIFMHGSKGFYDSKFPQGIGHVLLHVGDGKTIHAAGERLKDYPEKIVEVGQVVEEDLAQVLEIYKPLIVVKRFIEER